jgi:opacity protein-like surface antigen
MRKLIMLAVLMVCCASTIFAQSDEPKVEVFAGYSFLATQSRITNRDIRTLGGITPDEFKNITGVELTGNDRFMPTNGFEASVRRYFSKRVGLTADFSGYYHRETTRFAGTLLRSNTSVYTILGGPHVRFANKTRLTPFIHALVGAARLRTSYTEIGSTDPVTATDSSTRLAMAFGGGLDLRLSKRVSLRLFQLDYSPILGKARTVTASDSTSTDTIDLSGRAQDKNFRLSIGIVFR